MSEPDPRTVTALLRAWHAGDEDAYRRVSAILYGELRRRAAHYMRRRSAGDDTLQATGLVHEVFMRLVDAHQVDWHDRKHFLAVAARTMRRILIDLARGKAAVKHGARAVHLPLDSGVAVGGPAPLDLLALDEALDILATIDARKVRVIELRFFADVSPDTIARDWRMARTWLLRELDRGSKA